MGITERIFAQHVEATLPALTKALTASIAGEPPVQSVTGVDVCQRGGGMGAPADDPAVPEIGPQNLRQPRQVVLFIAEEPAVMSVADALPRPRRGAGTTPIGRAAPFTQAATGWCGGMRPGRQGQRWGWAGRWAGPRRGGAGGCG